MGVARLPSVLIMKYTRRQLLSATAYALLSANVPASAETIRPAGTDENSEAFFGDSNARFDTMDISGGIVFSSLPFSYTAHDNDSKPRVSSQIPAFIQVSASAIAATGKVVSPGGSVITGAALRPYERLEYWWDFGDPSGTESFNNYSLYPFSGVPVNANSEQRGPEACYVYRRPGTYTIKLNIRGRNSDGTGYISKIVTRQFTALANSRTHAFDTESTPFVGDLTNDRQGIGRPSSRANLTVGSSLTLIDTTTGRPVEGYLAPNSCISEIGEELRVATQSPGFERAILQNLTSAQMATNRWAIVPSNEFYFDSVNGDDSNGGNTPSTPKRGCDSAGIVTLPSQIAEIFQNVTSKVSFYFAYGSSWSSPTSIITNGDKAISSVRFAAYENQQARTSSNNPSFILRGPAVIDEASLGAWSPSESSPVIPVSLNMRNAESKFSVRPPWHRKSPGNNNPPLAKPRSSNAAPVSLHGSHAAQVGDIVFSNMDLIVDEAQPASSGVSCVWLGRGQTQVISDVYFDHCNYRNNSQGKTGAIVLYVNNPGSYNSRSMGQNFAVWGGTVTCKVFATYTDFMAYGSGNTLTVTEIKSYRGDPDNGSKPFNIARFITDGAQVIQDHGGLPSGVSFAPNTAIVSPIIHNGDGTWTVTLSRPMNGAIPREAPVNVWSTYGGSAVIAFGAMQWQTFMGIQESDNGGQGTEYCHVMNLECAGKHLLVRWIKTRGGPGWNNTIRNSTGAYNIGGISSAFAQPDLTGGYSLVADCDVQSTPYRWTELNGKGQQNIGTGFGGFGNEQGSDPAPFQIDAAQKFSANSGICSPQAPSACQIQINAGNARPHICQQLDGSRQVVTQMSVFDITKKAEVGVTLNHPGACKVIDGIPTLQLGSPQDAAMLGPPLISSAGTTDTLQFTNGGSANCVFERNNVANIKTFAIGCGANNMTVRDCNVYNFGKWGLAFGHGDYQAVCAYRNNFYRSLSMANFGNILFDNRNPVIWFYFGKPISNTLSQEFTYNMVWDDRGAAGSSNGPNLMRLDWESASAIIGGGGVFDMNRWYFPNASIGDKVMQSNSDGRLQTFNDYQTYGGSPAQSTPYFGPHDAVLRAPPWSDPGNGNFAQ